MDNFSWEDFKNSKIIVYCDTEEVRKDFLRQCAIEDIVWEDGSKIGLKNFREKEKQFICYTINSKSYLKQLKVNYWNKSSEKEYEIFNIVDDHLKYINWLKVPRGTKVQVRDNDKEAWKNMYFVRYSPFEEYKFSVSNIQDDEFTNTNMENCDCCSQYKYCRIYPMLIDVPDEWCVGGHKNIDRNNIYKIELTLENGDVIQFYNEEIKDFSINHKSEDGQISFDLTIYDYANTEYKPFDIKEMESINKFDRIIKHNDITRVKITLCDDTEEDYYIDYEEENPAELGSPNKNQTSYIDEEENLIIKVM